MNNSQSSFLKQVQQACTSSSTSTRAASFAELKAMRKDRPPLSLAPRNAEQFSQAELIELLQENAALLNLTVTVCTSWEEAGQAVVQRAQTAEPEYTPYKQVICHPDSLSQAMQLEDRFSQEEIPLHWTHGNAEQQKEQTIESYLGITFPECVIADSATIVQRTVPSFPRSTSLVPSIHIAVASANRLVPYLDQAYTKLKQSTLPNSLVFISGPSKTADIEAQMVHGAHGPREMHLILVTSDERTS